MPEPLVQMGNDSPLGRPLFLMRRLSGTAAGHSLVKAHPDEVDALCKDLGAQLARIHALRPPIEALSFLGDPPLDPVTDWIARMRQTLDELGLNRPVIEMGLRMLEIAPPKPGPCVLCHNDFRTGNYMVDGGTLTGILDWEFAGWGNPMQDIGWFTAPCWRFGALRRVAGGMGSLDAFLQGYATDDGPEPRLEDLAFWQLLATLRWAVIALAQAERHFSGEESSLELALTQHVVPELESDILDLTGALDHG